MKEEKPEPLSDAMRGKKHGFMKKGSRVKIPSGKTDFFRGPQLRIGRDGLRIFEKTIDWLALYASTQFKNGSDMVLCLRSEEYIGPKESIMPKKPTDNFKQITK